MLKCPLFCTHPTNSHTHTHKLNFEGEQGEATKKKMKNGLGFSTRIFSRPKFVPCEKPENTTPSASKDRPRTRERKKCCEILLWKSMEFLEVFRLPSPSQNINAKFIEFSLFAVRGSFFSSFLLSFCCHRFVLCCVVRFSPHLQDANGVDCNFYDCYLCACLVTQTHTHIYTRASDTQRRQSAAEGCQRSVVVIVLVFADEKWK